MATELSKDDLEDIEEMGYSSGYTVIDETGTEGSIVLDAGMAEILTILMDTAIKEPNIADVLNTIARDALQRSTVQTRMAMMKPKQVAYVAALALTGNKALSARQAGIHVRSTVNYSHNPVVQAAYQEIQAVINEQLLEQAVREYIMHILWPKLSLDMVINRTLELQANREERILKQVQKKRIGK